MEVRAATLTVHYAGDLKGSITGVEERIRTLAREEWLRRVPLPQVARDDFKESTREEKVILEAHKGIKERRGKFREKGTNKKNKEGKEAKVFDLEKNLKGQGDLEILAEEQSKVPPYFFDADYAGSLRKQFGEEAKEAYKTREGKKPAYLEVKDVRSTEYNRVVDSEKKEEVRVSYCLDKLLMDDHNQYLRKIGSKSLRLEDDYHRYKRRIKSR